MMTPEPSAAPDDVVTVTSTTDGRTFAITASRTVSMLFPLRGGIVTGEVGPVCNGAVVGAVLTAVFLPISHPANRPILRMTSTDAMMRMALNGKRGDCLGIGDVVGVVVAGTSHCCE